MHLTLTLTLTLCLSMTPHLMTSPAGGSPLCATCAIHWCSPSGPNFHKGPELGCEGLKRAHSSAHPQRPNRKRKAGCPAYSSANGKANVDLHQTGCIHKPGTPVPVVHSIVDVTSREVARQGPLMHWGIQRHASFQSTNPSHSLPSSQHLGGKTESGMAES